MTRSGDSHKLFSIVTSIVTMGRRKKKQTRRTPQTPFEVVDKKEWEVEAVKAKRWAKGILQYHIKWVDHDDNQNTWEPLENLVGAEGSIADFEEEWNKNYNAPTRKRPRETSTSLEEAQEGAAAGLSETVDQITDLADALSHCKPHACCYVA